MPPSPAQRQLLQQGVQARQDGRLAAARAAFAEVLRQQPEQPDALQMLAEVAQSQGELAEAETLLARALRASPEHPYAWSRLGQLRERQGRPADAAACFQRAVLAKPDLAEAHYNQARLQRLLAQPAEAALALAQALRLATASAPLRAQMLQLQALMQEEAGQPDAALATLAQAIAAAPLRAALHHNRAVLLQRQARAAEALAAHDTALGLGLDAPDAHYNRGNSLQSLGRPADALAAYHAALARDPQHALALYDIARLRWRLGDAAFAAELDAASAAAPASAVAPGIKGRLMLRAGRHAEAAGAFAQAVAAADTTAAYFDGLGQALARLGRSDEALAAHRRAVALAPQDVVVHVGLAGSLLQAGQAAAAARAAEAAVRIGPLDQSAWAVLGLAWQATGDVREAWLNDYRQHVQAYDLAPPPGWADMPSFNRALAAELEALHTDAEAPIDQTLRRGSQTLGELFEQSHPLVDQLKACIAVAVDRYIAQLRALGTDDAHPLLGRLAPAWRFTDSWSSRLRDGGFHTHHVHPHGWISSCYYVALPPAITHALAADTGPQPGWITFGVPDITVPGRDMRPRRAERPQAGRLVLFPSFMWHGTVPFSDAQARLTVAFDVMPLP
ncbi:MAG: tetratricopeptide repeat protein [Rubrivivax sp.]|nr:tetratricopeptide repeat protein [Rubrivivax sp.]